jgi:hypothetical protein
MADWRPVIADALLSGAAVSGAGVSDALLSGAGVSGAGVSGAAGSGATGGAGGARLITGVLPATCPLTSFDWGTLNATLRDQVVRIPACRMVRSGRVVDPALFTEGDRATSDAGAEVVVAGAVGQLLQAGASLVLQDIQRYHEPVRVLSRWLGWRANVPLFVNAFATPALGEALVPHSDPYSAWLLQTHGSKTWRVWPPGTDAASAPPEVDVTLAAGDALWIPRRWVHHGVSTERSSIHLTFAQRPLTAEPVDTVLSTAGIATEDSTPARLAFARRYRQRFIPLPARWPATAGGLPGWDHVHLHLDGIVWREDFDDGGLRLLTADDELVLSARAATAFDRLWNQEQAVHRKAIDSLFEGCFDAVDLLVRSRLVCLLTDPLECRLARCAV